MRRARLAAASLAAIATFAALEACRAEDQLKIAVGGRGIGETFVTEVGDKAGLFKRHNLALDIFYPEGRRFTSLGTANKINGFIQRPAAGHSSH